MFQPKRINKFTTHAIEVACVIFPVQGQCRSQDFVRTKRNMPRVPPGYAPVPHGYYYAADAEDYSDEEVECPTYPSWMNSRTKQRIAPWQQQASVDGMRDHQLHENVVGGVSTTVPPPDGMASLYQRKPDDRFVMQQELTVSDEAPNYYYPPTNVARKLRRRPLANTSHMIQQPHHPAYYPTQPERPPDPIPPVYEPLIYHNIPPRHRAMNPSTNVVRKPPQIMPEVVPPVSNMSRSVRHPKVAVRTPRYYKRVNTSLYKRPSALCLPLACQPDPAVHHRVAKSRNVPAATIHGVPPLRLPQTQQGVEEDEEEENAETAPPRSAPASIDIRSSRIRQMEQEHLHRVQNIILDRRDRDNAEKNDLRLKTNTNNRESDEVSNVGHLETKTSELDILLAQYHQQLINEGTYNVKSKTPSKTSVKSRGKNKETFRKISVSQLVKPRLPPSLKNKAAKTCDQDMGDSAKMDGITTELLDNLMKEMNKNNFGTTEPVEEFNDATKKESKTSACSSEISKKDSNADEENTHNKATDKKISDILNYSINKMEEFNPTTYYQEKLEEPAVKTTFIHEKTKLAQCDSSQTCFSQNPKRDIQSSRVSISTNVRKTKKTGSVKDSVHSPRRCSVKKSPWTSIRPKPAPALCNDEQTALELHRSKSYIVHLIDRALSRELGTIPEEKSSKQYVDLNPVSACEMISSPIVKNVESDMCLEINNALAGPLVSNQKQQTDPQTSNSVANPSNIDANKLEQTRIEGELLYPNKSDEPMYIKQLKKIRWAHFRQIQSEMKRLEDLERYLDSCSAENE
ncbi:hypothetical protein CBL_09915 [Carabus blaptoides fortunei]